MIGLLVLLCVVAYICMGTFTSVFVVQVFNCDDAEIVICAGIFWFVVLPACLTGMIASAIGRRLR